ncbi:MAG: hypothetical protein AAGF90_17665 [Pseudomonadota bacterium]
MADEERDPLMNFRIGGYLIGHVIERPIDPPTRVVWKPHFPADPDGHVWMIPREWSFHSERDLNGKGVELNGNDANLSGNFTQDEDGDPEK